MGLLGRFSPGLWLRGAIHLLSRAAAPQADVLTNGMEAAHFKLLLLLTDF